MNIDIVITSFNRRSKINKAIDSALDFTEQSGGKVIVVDDASSDGTLGVLLNDYKIAIKKQHLLLHAHKINQGVTAAKNTGYMLSTASWVVFLDSDDTLIPDQVASAIKVMSENSRAPIIFFRCYDNDGKVVGTPFTMDKWLSIAEYVENTSYGEVLTAINRKMITSSPYIDELRGYEGIGCARIIRDYGNALLSILILREYDQSGNDRLSSGWGFAKRLGKLAKGHTLFLKEFNSDMVWSMRIKYVLKIAVYFFVSLFVKALGKK